MPNIEENEQIAVDGICSLARYVPITTGKKVDFTTNIPAEEGTLVIGQVLNEKKRYNRLERVSGRKTRLIKGKTYVFVLGNRAATDGFVGVVPESIQVGDCLQILNLGGIVGHCTSTNLRYVGSPINIRLKGAVSVKGQPANMANFSPIKPADRLLTDKPLIIVFGSSMNSGKTSVARKIIKVLRQYKKKIGACKVTGAGCMKDTLSMKKAGARHTYDLADVGLASTVTKKDTLAAAKGLVNKLSEYKLDYIVIEIGDGLISEYHGHKVVYDKSFIKRLALSVACARDLSGAWGIKTLVSQHGSRVDIFAGPVTDNEAGANYIKKHWQLPIVNARYSSDDFYEVIARSLGLIKESHKS